MLFEIIRRVRKNHALEHGTVTLLLENGIRPPLGGYSTPGGFFIFGKVSKETVTGAVNRAFEEMRGGHSELAISPYCGTNIATGFALAALLSNLIMKRGKNRIMKLPLAVLTFVGALSLSRPIGNLLQRRFTTLAEMENFHVHGITSFAIGSFSIHRVNTESH